MDSKSTGASRDDNDERPPLFFHASERTNDSRTSDCPDSDGEEWPDHLRDTETYDIFIVHSDSEGDYGLARAFSEYIVEGLKPVAAVTTIIYGDLIENDFDALKYGQERSVYTLVLVTDDLIKHWYSKSKVHVTLANSLGDESLNNNVVPVLVDNAENLYAFKCNRTLKYKTSHSSDDSSRNLFHLLKILVTSPNVAHKKRSKYKNVINDRDAWLKDRKSKNQDELRNGNVDKNCPERPGRNNPSIYIANMNIRDIYTITDCKNVTTGVSADQKTCQLSRDLKEQLNVKEELAPFDPDLAASKP